MSAERYIRGLLWLALLGFASVEVGVVEPLCAAEPADAAARQEILGSPAWAAAVDGFHQWLGVQVVYPKEQVPQLRADFQARVDKLTAAELGSFLADLQQKLAILSSPLALETRAWADDRLNLYTAARAAEFRKSMPDIAGMTPLQLEQALEDLKRRRATDLASAQNFARFRDQQVAAASAAQQAAATAAAVAAANYHPGTNGGSYAPRSTAPRTIQRYPGFAGWNGGWRW